MILSHQHRFIFIKTRKTAGTSLEIGLARFCGPNDVVTPISSEDTEILPQWGHKDRNWRVPWKEYQLREWARLLLRGRRSKYHKHMEARHVRQRVSPEIWRSYYKFCFERNPWDKAISLYHWRTKSEYWRGRPRWVGLSLSEFLKQVEPGSLSNFDVYSINGTVAVDHVAKYENLDAELEALRQRLGLSEPINLPRTKARSRTDRRPYQEVLTPDDRAIIERVCGREIALMGYTYDEDATR